VKSLRGLLLAAAVFGFLGWAGGAPLLRAQDPSQPATDQTQPSSDQAQPAQDQSQTTPDQEEPAQTQPASPSTNQDQVQDNTQPAAGPETTPAVVQPVPESTESPLDANTVQPVTAETATTTSTTEADILRSRVGPNYLIGPEDVLTIDVFDVPELSKMDVQVGNDGTITVPLLGAVKAAGLTQRQLRAELTREWGAKYLQHPQVTLFIKEFKSRPVAVVGSVEKPGEYYLTGRRTLVEVLAMAGGLAKGGQAAGRDVLVQRPTGFKDLPQVDGLRQTDANTVAINLKKLVYEQDRQLNLEIEPFDTVSVSRPDLVYLAGDFTKPGAYVLENKTTVTVLEAVAMAQGVGANARTSKAAIIRRSQNGESTMVSFDLKKVLEGKAPDATLAANDILFVPNSAAKSVGRQSISSIIGIVSGLVIYRGL
jgi:polysaccharide biosynthesis/export protein